RGRRPGGAGRRRPAAPGTPPAGPRAKTQPSPARSARRCLAAHPAAPPTTAGASRARRGHGPAAGLSPGPLPLAPPPAPGPARRRPRTPFRRMVARRPRGGARLLPRGRRRRPPLLALPPGRSLVPAGAVRVRGSWLADNSAYAELAATSNFSFLRGASHPHELVATAKALGLAALGLADRNSVAGVVRAHTAARSLDLRLLVGARLVPLEGPEVLCYPRDRAAWARLCRLLTLGKRRAEKGDCRFTFEELLAHGEG